MAKRFNVQDTATKFLSGAEEIQEEKEVKVVEEKIQVESKTLVQEQEDVSLKAGRKPNKEKRVQVSVYLTEEMFKELRVQSALKEKESDKSAFARTGIEIALSLSDETYSKMKSAANERNTTPGNIIEEALSQYL